MSFAIHRFTTQQAPKELLVKDNEKVLCIEDGFSALPDSRMTLVRVQDGGLLFYSLNLAGRNNLKRHMTIELGQGTEMRLFGLAYARGDQQISLKVQEDHQGEFSIGRTTVRALVAGQSRLDFNGLISIRPQANHSDALLEGRAILLSEDARSTMDPRLEIEAREVRATHAAAVGPLDPEQVFYLMARGLSRQEAERFIFRGFFHDLLHKLPVESEQKRLAEQWQEVVK